MFNRLSISVICSVLFLHPGDMRDVRHVVGYINESVVLYSGADPSWNLRQIHWSVYENTTYIAFFQDQIKSVEHFLFHNRLKLDKVTGDLTITSVLPRDALEYRVDLSGQQTNQRKTNYVQLSVQEPLAKPKIKLLHRYLDSDTCVISLSCSSENRNSSLIWQPSQEFNESVYSGPRGDTGELVLWTSFTPNRPVKFICTQTIGHLNGVGQSSYVTVNCTEAEKNKESSLPRSIERVVGGLIGGLAGIVVGFLIAFCLLKHKGGTYSISNQHWDSK